VRLGACIAFELAIAAGAMGGLWIGVGHGLRLAGTYLSERDAAAATVPPPRAMPTHLPTASLKVDPPAAPKTVFEAPDDVLLAPLGGAPVIKIKPNHGGTSLSLRLDFANGARASFKPEQTWPQSDPRREVAAYRMDRLLGIGHVPPAKPISFTVAELINAAEPSFKTYVTTRLADEAIAREGVLHGMVSWWIPEIRDAKMGALRVDEVESIAAWTSYLQIGATIPPQHRVMTEQLATCIVFDIIVDNADRWSGSNTKASPDQQILYFMDNTLSFSKFTWGHDNNVRPLRKIQKFPRGLIKRLRTMTREMIEAALDLGPNDGGLGKLLQPEEISAILARRDHVLEYVDGLIAQFGEDAVLALP
jgi:hypothetical protein